jgi:uncharacterized protein
MFFMKGGEIRMQCPVCQVSLLMTDRQGVEIDYCPKCRGIWLDRGELEKLIDLSTAQLTKVSSYRPEETRNEYRPHEHDDRSYHDEKKSQHKKKKGGLLGDLFDF